MVSPLFLDANIPFYATGRPHPLREPCRHILTLVFQQPEAFITDAEVLQEMLHRYVAIRAWADGRDAFDSFADLVRGRVEPVYAGDVEDAASLAGLYASLSARDLIHVAVMRRLNVTRVVSADQGFDAVSELQRLDPSNLSEWQVHVGA